MEKLFLSWIKIPRPIRFLFIGGINFFISYVVFILCTLLIGKQHYQLCVVLQWVLSSVPSYINHKFFVFCTKGNYISEYLKCFSTWIVGYFLNAIILEIFVYIFGKKIYVGQFISAFLVSLITYVIFKVFAFKPKNDKNN